MSEQKMKAQNTVSAMKLGVLFSALVTVGLFQNCGKTAEQSSSSELYLPGVVSVTPVENVKLSQKGIICQGPCYATFEVGGAENALAQISTVCQGDLKVSEAGMYCTNDLSISRRETNSPDGPTTLTTRSGQ